MVMFIYPEIKANRQIWLPTTDGHQIYLEESGNQNGYPVIYCHGGREVQVVTNLGGSLILNITVLLFLISAAVVNLSLFYHLTIIPASI